MDGDRSAVLLLRVWLADGARTFRRPNLHGTLNVERLAVRAGGDLDDLTRLGRRQRGADVAVSVEADTQNARIHPGSLPLTISLQDHRDGRPGQA